MKVVVAVALPPLKPYRMLPYIIDMLYFLMTGMVVPVADPDISFGGTRRRGRAPNAQGSSPKAPRRGVGCGEGMSPSPLAMPSPQKIFSIFY